MNKFANWSVRNKLLIPVAAAIVTGGLVTFLTFVELTQSIRDVSVRHIQNIGKLRAAVLDLTGEYREYVVESVPEVAKEIMDGKAQAKLSLQSIFTHDNHQFASLPNELGKIESLLESLQKNGDGVVSVQSQIVSGQDILEAWENTATKALNSVREVIEREVGNMAQAENMGFRMSSKMTELHNFHDFGYATLELVSETREFILTGEDETLEELRVTRNILSSSLAGYAQNTKNIPEQIVFVSKLKGLERSLVAVSGKLINLTLERAELLEETEYVAEQLQDLLATIVATENQKLGTLFENQHYIVLATIVVVLFLVILALVVSFQRINVALSDLNQATFKISHGDLNARASVSAGDELGVLATNFNQMAASLEENIASRERAETQMKSLNSDLENRVVVRTIQLEKARIDAEAASQAKTSFLATMSHELRTPLTSIIGALGLLKTVLSDQLNDQTKELIDISKRNSDSMLLLINELLDFEKVTSGTMSIETQRHDIGVLTAKIVGDNQSYANSHSVTFDYSEPESPLFAKIQDHRFQQVLRNLLSNAAKFSPPGSEVCISVIHKNGAVIIGVKDSGPGIPEEFKTEIFEPFTQIDSSQSRKHAGTGLGLSICKSLTEAMGGKLYYDTELGVGSTFYISFPALK